MTRLQGYRRHATRVQVTYYKANRWHTYKGTGNMLQGIQVTCYKGTGDMYKASLEKQETYTPFL